MSKHKETDKTSDPIILDRTEVLHNNQKYWFVRRLQDFLFSLIALILLSPLMLIVSLIIWIDDPHGSPFFSQIRCGRDGKEFKMYKFRSMYVDAEEKLEQLMGDNEMDGPVFKIKNDPRITRIGRFIRMTSIDELPQLINVLRGEMSIVGPRPALPREVEQYDEIQLQRLYVTPGLTCYWQVQPQRNSLSFDEWLNLDLKYIQERNFLVDWKIIFETIGVIFKGEGI